MTLYYDLSEVNLLPEDVIAYGKPCAFLEEVTGADMLVTITPFPCTTEILLARHIERGAIMIQRKSGGDLINSFGARLNTAIVNMLSCKAKSSNQRVLLYTGIFAERGGNLVLNDKQLNTNYMSFRKALDWWQYRGGKVANLPSDSLILPWVQSLEKDLETLQEEKQVEFYPSFGSFPPDEDVLQLPIEVRDWRVTLATFPGIGPEKCNALFNHLKEIYNQPVTLWIALHYIMQDESKVPGWGKAAKQSVKRWLGIETDTDFYFGYHLFPYAKNIRGKIVEVETKAQPVVDTEANFEFFRQDAIKKGNLARAFRGLPGEQGVEVEIAIANLHLWFDKHGVGDIFRNELEKKHDV